MNSDSEPRPGILSRNGATIAYRRIDGATPGVVFLGGFMSDMQGTKALALERHCRAAGRAFLRFDYQGHGESSGKFADGTIGIWTDDALAALDRRTFGRQILVGSSMGGWIMLLAALARPDRVAGLVGVAAAPDFTEDLLWERLGDAGREELAVKGSCMMPGGDEPVTMKLVEDGRKRLLLRRPIPLRCPVRLLHGMRDEDVPWTTSVRLAERLLSDDARVVLVKDGDHRLSRDGDIDCLTGAIDELAGRPAIARSPAR